VVKDNTIAFLAVLAMVIAIAFTWLILFPATPKGETGPREFIILSIEHQGAIWDEEGFWQVDYMVNGVIQTPAYLPTEDLVDRFLSELEALGTVRWLGAAE